MQILFHCSSDNEDDCQNFIRLVSEQFILILSASDNIKDQVLMKSKEPLRCKLEQVQITEKNSLDY